MVLKALIWDAYHLESDEIISRYIDMIVAEVVSRGHEVSIAKSLDSAIQLVQDAEFMVCWKIVPEVFAASRRLQWIQFGSAGIDHTLFPELIDSSVILTTLSGIHKTPVAEHVLGLMLTMSRRINIAVQQQIERNYDRRRIAFSAEELQGKTVGIIGLGKIGLEIARLCKCFGMTVIGTKRRVGESLPYVDGTMLPTALDELLCRSDYIVIVVPLTEESRCLIGRREFNLMKPSVRLINVGRGAMIDEDALIWALQNGEIAGAALDVFTHEPLTPESPLYDTPNLIITPHVAGSHQGYAKRAFEIFKINLDAFEFGSPMINVFSRSQGY